MTLPCGLHLPIHEHLLQPILADRLQHDQAWLLALGNSFIRAAANSIANGSPSRRTQIAAMARAVASVI
ncbi:MAG TPA: hypothetical protein VJ761_08545 [Ktedonobacteraceae bacterium]|nr:hypothetical protein [Ktedonobacteraceae bacterium]